jgi:hypothetical protein
VGGISSLATRGSANGEADSSAHQRNHARFISRYWKARAAQARPPRLLVSSNQCGAPHGISCRERRSLDRATALPLLKFREPDSSAWRRSSRALGNLRQAHTHFCPTPIGTDQLDVAPMRSSELPRNAQTQSVPWDACAAAHPEKTLE